MLKPVNSSKRVGRILLAFGLLFRLRLLKRKKVAKYLQGSLFVLGGYLKNEAKSYLKSIEDCNMGMMSPQKVVVQEGQNPRKLDSNDFLFFEDGAMLRACQYFVKSIVIMASKSSYSLYGAINRENFDFYVDYTSQMYIEANYTKNGLPPDPTLKDTIQTTHYSLLSLFDMIQYIFEHLILYKLKGEFRIRYTEKQRVNDQEQCTKFVANCQSLNQPYRNDWKWLDSLEYDQQENKTQEEQSKTKHSLKFPPIVLRKLPGGLKLDWQYKIPGTSELVCTILHGIQRISQAPLDLYCFWVSKRQYNKSSANVKRNSQANLQNKDGYTRTENYNSVGIATYYCLMLIFQERHRASIEKISGKQIVQEFGTKTGIPIGCTFPIPISHEQKLRMMLPLLEKLVTQTLQRPNFFYNLAFITLERVLLPFLIQEQEIPALSSDEQNFLKEILAKLVKSMGTTQQDSTPIQSEEIGRSMGLLLKKILSRFSKQKVINIYYYLMSTCNNQNASRYIIDCLRSDFGNRQLLDQKNGSTLLSILKFALQIKLNYQEEFERVYSGLTFLKYLTIQKGKKGLSSQDFKIIKQSRLNKIYDDLNTFMSQESKQIQNEKVASQIQKIPKDTINKLKMISEMVKNISF